MRRTTRTVATLAGLVGATVVGDAETEITDVTHDSRDVREGSLFVATRGQHVDGHTFIPTVAEAGAVAVCVDHPTAVTIPQLVVENTRQVMGELSAAVHDYPSKAMHVIGVTGTNGKTTVTHFVDSIARHADRVTGLVGTIHTRSVESSSPATLTTPEAPDFQRLLAEMRDEGVELVATEVSSHALEFGRVRGTRFAVAAFTNLSQDHLDFHGDMGAYRAAKKRLFTEYEVATAVINIDDPVGRNLAADYVGELITIGTGGDFSVVDIESLGRRTEFTLNTPQRTTRLTAPVIGEFNVSNLVVAAACCVATGIDPDTVIEGVSAVTEVPGRFEIISGDDPITVIVDYAHTPEGVTRAVATARTLGSGRVIGLIGAGGDRDRAKRPAMGRAISEADVSVITSDNPRHEDPVEIAAAVMSGVDPSTDHILEIDRRTAIGLAINAAEEGDVVLILGRGHEQMQDLGSEKVAFNDREVAAASLYHRRSAESNGQSGSMS